MSAVGRVLAWVALTPIVVLVAGIGGCEVRKAYYDSQVRKMCEKDGGVTVIESVTLKRAEYEGFLNQFHMAFFAPADVVVSATSS